MRTPRSDARWRRSANIAVAALLATFYCLVFFVPMRAKWPAPLRDAQSTFQGWIYTSIDAAARTAGLPRPANELRRGLYLVITAALIPWSIMALLGRWRLYDLGTRRPNRFGWRYVLVGFLIALPFLAWMVRGEQFAAPYYLPEAGQAVGPVLVYYETNIFVEHFLLNGVVLALLRADRRWPAPPPQFQHKKRRLARSLQWLGFAQPTAGAGGIKRITRWLGLPDGCLAALVVSGLLFGLVHLGKDARELVLSVPGGFAAAFIAYRTNCWLIPIVLHTVTAGTVLLLLYAAR